MRKDNRGFTLLELIVVAAIIAVLATMLTMNTAPIFTQSVRSSAQDLQQLLADARTNAYAKDGSNNYLEIKSDASGRLKATQVQGSDEEVTNLGRYSETLKYNGTELSKGTPFYIMFDKDTGELTCFGLNRTANSYNTGSIQNGVITLSKGSITFEVTIDGLTGRSSFKRIYS